MFGEDRARGPHTPNNAVATSHHESGRIDLSFLDPPTEPGDLGRIAHYRVLGVLGVGGMGVVFRAEDAHLHRVAALKVMRREFVDNYTSRERFLLEARAAASLQSDNIVTVYQVGMHNDVPYLAMQYLLGETLDSRMDRDPPLSLPDSLLIVRQVAAGLACAHDHGLVHRDVKPANIWLEADPHARGAVRAKLLDFGLARVIDSARKLTNMGQILGTPQFMAPEQACGSPTDGRADLFSLGSVLYTLVTGHLPFAAPTTAALLVAIVSTEPTPAILLNSSVPPPVNDLIQRMLAKAPADRPATAHEVVDALDEILIEYSLPALRSLGPASTRMNTATPRTIGAGLVTPVQLAAPTRTVPPAGGPTMDAPAGKSAPPVTLTPVPPQRPSRMTPWLVGLAGVAAASVVALGVGLSGRDAAVPPPGEVAPEDVAVGVLFATAGPSAAFERPLADATALAIDELNAKGGVLGRKVVADYPQNVQTGPDYVTAATQLVRDRGRKVVFGTAVSADRRGVLPVIERANGLLFYAPAYEGMESSARAVYLGPTAAQQVVPALDYLLTKGHARVFVVGVDGIYTHALVEVVGDRLKGHQSAKLVGTGFIPAGETDFRGLRRAIEEAKPDLIVSAIRGGAVIRVIEELRGDRRADPCPVLHLNHLEDLSQAFSPDDRAGDYVAGAFLETSPDPRAQQFVAAYRNRYGSNRAVTDSAASAYSAVHLWAAAVRRAESLDPDAVLAALPNLPVATPVGELVADAERRFAFPLIVSRFQPDGTLEEVYRTDTATAVYPPSRPPSEWDRMLRTQFYRWNESWTRDTPAKAR